MIIAVVIQKRLNLKIIEEFTRIDLGRSTTSFYYFCSLEMRLLINRKKVVGPLTAIVIARWLLSFFCVVVQIGGFFVSFIYGYETLI